MTPMESGRMNISGLERMSVYKPSILTGDHNFDEFISSSGNELFQRTPWTWVALGLILVAYPGQALLGISADPGALLKGLSQSLLIFMLLATIVFQWVIFGINYAAIYTEGTGMAGVGLGRLKLIHLGWAIAFFAAANLVLSGLAWLLALIGMPMTGEVSYLVPTTPWGRVVWVLLSITAGICEEVAFRGYLLTRLRILGKYGGWTVPILISSVLFGASHIYQGLPNVLVLSVYGGLFALLYVRTGSLWPCVIAHTLNNLVHGFWPQ